MPLWPFGRKRRRRAVVSSSPAPVEAVTDDATELPSRAADDPSVQPQPQQHQQQQMQQMQQMQQVQQQQQQQHQAQPIDNSRSFSVRRLRRKLSNSSNSGARSVASTPDIHSGNRLSKLGTVSESQQVVSADKEIWIEPAYSTGQSAHPAPPTSQPQQHSQGRALHIPLQLGQPPPSLTGPGSSAARPPTAAAVAKTTITATTTASASVEDVTALPLSTPLRRSPHLRPVTRDQSDIIPYSFLRNSPGSGVRYRLLSSEGVNSATDFSTLRPQSATGYRRRGPTDSPLVRRKSSNRRKVNSPIHEEEIRSLSAPLSNLKYSGVAALPATAMLARESRKVRNSYRNTSAVSLPIHDSVHSAMSGTSNVRAFVLGSLDVLSPRPVFRVAAGPQQNHPTISKTKLDAISRSGSAHGKKPLHQAEQEPKSKSREGSRRGHAINELADELDSGALREVLERDQRRRDRRRKVEAERLQRKLQRKAEKQRQDELGESSATGALGLGFDEPRLTSNETSRPKISTKRAKISGGGTDGSLRPINGGTYFEYPSQEHLPQPDMDSFADDAQVFAQTRLDSPTPPEMTTPDGGTAIRGNMDKKLGTPLAVRQLPTIVSAGPQMPHEDATEAAQETVGASQALVNYTPEATPPPSGSTSMYVDQRDSEVAGRRRTPGWLSFLRRSRGSQKRDSSDQTRTESSQYSFSSGSRESMSRQHASALIEPPTSQPAPAAADRPAAPLQMPQQAERELPSSQQPRTAHSPSRPARQPPPIITAAAAVEAARYRPIASLQGLSHASSRSVTPVRTMSRFREELPELPLSPPDSRLHSPIADQQSGKAAAYDFGEQREGDEYDGARSESPSTPDTYRISRLMSTSIASIDSEGSWLSGARNAGSKRSSQQTNHVRASVGSGVGSVRHTPVQEQLALREQGDEQPQPQPQPQSRRKQTQAHPSRDVGSRSPVPFAAERGQPHRAGASPINDRRPSVVSSDSGGHDYSSGEDYSDAHRESLTQQLWPLPAVYEAHLRSGELRLGDGSKTSPSDASAAASPFLVSTPRAAGAAPGQAAEKTLPGPAAGGVVASAEGTIFHQGRARRATVTHGKMDRVRSREGLLDEVSAAARQTELPQTRPVTAPDSAATTARRDSLPVHNR